MCCAVSVCWIINFDVVYIYVLILEYIEMDHTIDTAVNILKAADVVVAPTETVYGLFGDATSDKAIQKIYNIKGRPLSNPLIIHVSSIEMAQKYCKLNKTDIELIDKFWNIERLPITFVVHLRKNTDISRLVTAGLRTIAIRRPNNDITLQMITKFGKPLAAPSANTSTMVSPTSAQMVRTDLGDKVPLIIDGQECKVGVESTILDITKDPYVVLRHGGAPIEMISGICGKNIIENKNETCIIAPGMMKRHYAPSIPLRMNAEAPREGEAFITFGSDRLGENLSIDGDLNEAAHNLFSLIKKCDNPDMFNGIAVMPIPNIGIGKAINDRLKRASTQITRKVLLVILDGFGYSEEKLGNATLEAGYIKNLIQMYPFKLLNASGTAVGLPEGQFGNSEVGHLTIGTGRVIKQKLPMLSDAIVNGEFDHNHKLIDTLKLMDTCHIMGLFSEGGVHSHISHFFHCLALLRKYDILIKAHLFLDGRDVAKDDALRTLQDALNQKKIFIDEIATVHGRYYAMDRNKNWDRTEISYKAIKNARSEYTDISDPIKMIENFYANGLYDEEIPPFVMNGYKGMKQGDSVWMMNFRADRIQQILRMIQQDGYKTVNMVNIDEEIDKNSVILFENRKIKNTLGEVVSNHGLRQFRLAETEKYAHVTYFFNGGEDIQYEGEDRILIDSPDVADYAEIPDMSSAEITTTLIEAVRSEKYEFIVVNYASPDMIGHTGNFEAAKAAIRCLDKHVKSVVEEGGRHGYQILITADHGNAEHMINQNQTVCKTHTCAQVPLICIGTNTCIDAKSLQDIAPIVLKLLGIDIPLDMK